MKIFIIAINLSSLINKQNAPLYFHLEFLFLITYPKSGILVSMSRSSSSTDLVCCDVAIPRVSKTFAALAVGSVEDDGRSPNRRSNVLSLF